MKKKFLFSLAALALIGTTLASCGGDGGDDGKLTTDDDGNIVYEDVEITFTHVITGTDSSYLTNLINEFNEEWEGKIEVVANSVAPNDLYTSLPNLTSFRRNADVMLIHADHVLQFAGQEGRVEGESAYFRELEDIMELSKVTLEAEDFPPQIWENMRFNDHQYGIPFDLHMAGLYVNTTLLEELDLEMPTNREEVIQCAKVARDNGYVGLPIATGYPDTYYYQNGFYNYGGHEIVVEGDEYFDENQKLSDGRVVVAQPGVYVNDAAKKTAQSLRELIYEEKVSEPRIVTDGGLQDFYDGKALFNLDGIWLLNDFINHQTTGEKDYEFDVLPASTLFNSTANPDYTGDISTNGHIFVMPKNTHDGENETRQQASMEFIKWMLEHSTDWAKSGKIAAYAPARESDEYKAIPHLEGFGDIENFRCIEPNKYSYVAFSPSWQITTYVKDFTNTQNGPAPTDSQIDEKLAELYNDGLDQVKMDMTGI